MQKYRVVPQMKRGNCLSKGTLVKFRDFQDVSWQLDMYVLFQFYSMKTRLQQQVSGILFYFNPCTLYCLI